MFKLPENWKSQLLKGLIVIVLSILGVQGVEQSGLLSEDEPTETIISFADYQANPEKFVPTKPDPAAPGECIEFWRVQGWALTTYEVNVVVDVQGGNPHQADGRGVGQSWLWISETVRFDAGQAFEDAKAKQAFLQGEARIAVQNRIGKVGHVFGRWFEDPVIYMTRAPQCN